MCVIEYFSAKFEEAFQQEEYMYIDEQLYANANTNADDRIRLI